MFVCIHLYTFGYRFEAITASKHFFINNISSLLVFVLVVFFLETIIQPNLT
jgi:hypothetical protein